MAARTMSRRVAKAALYGGLGFVALNTVNNGVRTVASSCRHVASTREPAAVVKSLAAISLTVLFTPLMSGIIYVSLPVAGPLYLHNGWRGHHHRNASFHDLLLAGHTLGDDML